MTTKTENDATGERKRVKPLTKLNSLLRVCMVLVFLLSTVMVLPAQQGGKWSMRQEQAIVTNQLNMHAYVAINRASVGTVSRAGEVPRCKEE